MFPEGVIDPMAEPEAPEYSVNHKFPSGPAVIP
jgi:hypothetical protein